MGLLSRWAFGRGRSNGRDLAGDPRESAPPAEPSARIKDIIWDDDGDARRQVSDATRAPYSSICLIHAYANVGDAQAVLAGTGWLAGPDLVVTAAHVVYDPQHVRGATGARAGVVQMWFGFNDDPVPPYGDAISTKIFIPRAYRDTLAADHDIAVIRLEQRIGDGLEWFEPQTPPAQALKENTVSIAGYPGERDKRFKLYEAEKRILDVSETRLYHNIDTTAGQSGAPVFSKSGRRPAAYGVHARGLSEAFNAIGMNANFAVRFRPELVKWIRNPSN